jgi:L-fuculose-phosphate aldolase
MCNRSSLAVELKAAYRYLLDKKLTFGAAGNISVRTPQGMLISGAGTRGSSLTEESFVMCDFEGQALTAGKPSSEWAMHAEVYRAYDGAQAIIHTHSDNCVALATQRRPLPAFHYMIARFGGEDVRCTPYAQFGSQELAAAAIEALAGRNACLLGNHGMICYGASLQQALETAELLETLARQYLFACASGVPQLLSEREIKAALLRYQTYSVEPPAISDNPDKKEETAQ